MVVCYDYCIRLQTHSIVYGVYHASVMVMMAMAAVAMNGRNAAVERDECGICTS